MSSCSPIRPHGDNFHQGLLRNHFDQGIEGFNPLQGFHEKIRQNIEIVSDLFFLKDDFNRSGKIPHRFTAWG